MSSQLYWTSSRTYDLDNYASTAKSYHPFQIVRFLLHSMYVCCGNGSSRYGSFTPQIGINQERELNATHFTIFDPTLIRVDMCRCYQLVEARSLATNRNVSYYTFCNVYMYIFEVSQRVPRYSFMYMYEVENDHTNNGDYRRRQFQITTNYNILIEKISSKANNIQQLS